LRKENPTEPKFIRKKSEMDLPHPEEKGGQNYGEERGASSLLDKREENLSLLFVAPSKRAETRREGEKTDPFLEGGRMACRTFPESERGKGELLRKA